ncbi:M24 family metallopeptidase [Aquidulcibacter paucihalophilus]|uniref:M24 family metallopeptidase n=1 Tax=Aquidulcibacter paucihalophilus TaxID=1978549 RepID=UPI000A196AB1|nr:M24 family metallopeptidase [Aquidulcibacter paucihalophilus]
MTGLLDPREANHAHFSLELQEAAQARAWETLARAAAMIEPGMNDLDGKAIVDQAILDSGAERLWHASQVRFGPNTLLPFGQAPATPHVLEADDIFFLDIGPCYDGHEGDVGSAFTLGQVPAFHSLIEDSKAVFAAVKAHWAETGANGLELYDFAKTEAAKRGRTLALEGASGHRIGAFPHRVHHSGKLKAFGKTPSPACWILEIHLIDPTLKVGAFYEDML